MKQTVKVAAVQMEVQWLDPEANLAKMSQAMEKIAAEGAIDLVVFPELANSGYVKSKDANDFPEFSRAYLNVAEKIPGPFTKALGELAKKHGSYIVCGILEAHPIVAATLYNSAVLLSPSGQLVGVHRKSHLSSEEKHYFYPGNTAEVFHTDLGNIGILICADTSFPEMARVLVLKGAEIVSVCYNRFVGGGRDPSLYYSVLACRAFENTTYFIGCNRVGTEGNLVFNGRSCICGPIGEFLARSDVETEDIIRATLSEEALQKARLSYARFRDRRPELYRILCEPL